MRTAGIGMPDRDYYLSQDAKLVEIRAAYLAHLEKMLALAGEPDGAARARSILDFETKVARAHWTLLTDPHSPAEQRTAVVRNLDAWYSAFGVSPGQRLYLPSEQRIRIW